MEELLFGGSALVVILGVAVILLLLWLVPVQLWITALASGVYVPLTTLIGMRLRKVTPSAIIRPLISATKAGLRLNTRDLEAHYLAGGKVGNVVNALISADKANIDLDFKRAAAIDLAGRDVLEAVQVSVNLKVIQTPRVAAVAKDGIQLIATARVTVRANIHRLVGGAGEETILARVGEGIVSTIGSAESHKAVLENPNRISKTVLEKGLDSGTAFEILSIDIADVDVGKNIGAELQTDQAEADKRVAQARAEERAGDGGGRGTGEAGAGGGDAGACGGGRGVPVGEPEYRERRAPADDPSRQSPAGTGDRRIIGLTPALD
jgi:uncharacterized protein YqfA (UPF0365 family)